MRRRYAATAALCAAGIGLGVGLSSTSASATVDDNYYVVSTSSITLHANTNGEGGQANCNTGDTAMSGGFQLSNPTDIQVVQSNPDYSVGHGPTGWYAGFNNKQGIDRSVYVVVVCLDT